MKRDAWYIVAFELDLRKSQFIKKQINGFHILIGKANNGDFFAIEDRCCHRNVQLSLGEFDGKSFTCGYHGWQYNCQGECIHIPSQPNERKISKKVKIDSYPIKLKYKMLWVNFTNKTDKNIPPIPEMETQPFIVTSHKFNGDVKFVSESLFDPYHINHVHKKSIKTFMGTLTEEKPNFHVSEDETSISGYYNRVNTSNIFEKMYFGSSPTIRTTFEFHYPNISKIKICFEKRTLTIYEHIVETDNGEIEMIQLTLWDNIFNFFPMWLSKRLMKRISNTIVGEDIEFFKSHNRLKKQHTREAHVQADELSLAFRNLWDKQNVK